MPNRPKIVVVMPAYNAAKTLRFTYADLPPGLDRSGNSGG